MSARPGRGRLPFDIGLTVMDTTTWRERTEGGGALDQTAEGLDGMDMILAECRDALGVVLVRVSSTVDARPRWDGLYGGLDEATATWVLFEVVLPALAREGLWPRAACHLEMGGGRVRVVGDGSAECRCGQPRSGPHRGKGPH